MILAVLELVSLWIYLNTQTKTMREVIQKASF